MIPILYPKPDTSGTRNTFSEVYCDLRYVVTRQTTGWLELRFTPDEPKLSMKGKTVME